MFINRDDGFSIVDPDDGSVQAVCFDYASIANSNPELFEQLTVGSTYFQGDEAENV